MRHQGASAWPGLSVQADLWLVLDGRPLCGRSRAALLEAVADTGSINSAARHLGISYKGAWGSLHSMSKQVGAALTRAECGHQGTRLTMVGQEFLALYQSMVAMHQQTLAEMARQLSVDP